MKAELTSVEGFGGKIHSHDSFLHSLLIKSDNEGWVHFCKSIGRLDRDALIYLIAKRIETKTQKIETIDQGILDLTTRKKS